MGRGDLLMNTLGLVLGKRVMDLGSTVAPLRVNSVILNSTFAPHTMKPSVALGHWLQNHYHNTVV